MHDAQGQAAVRRIFVGLTLAKKCGILPRMKHAPSASEQALATTASSRGRHAAKWKVSAHRRISD
jgi:hypothetical protein